MYLCLRFIFQTASRKGIMRFVLSFIAFLYLGQLIGDDIKIAELVKLAEHYKEAVKPNNIDLLNPNYFNYYKQRRPSVFTKMCRIFGFAKDPFDINLLISMLNEVITQQRSRGRMGNFIIGTQFQKNKLIIIGNIQGAFHSLVNDIEELYKQGIIDENLKIIDPKVIIIFNGASLIRSPFILETLFCILSLLKKNPEQVITLRNDFFKDGLWRDLGFRAEVQIIYQSYGQALDKLCQDFLDTNAMAFYVNTADKPAELLKITALKDFTQDNIEGGTGNFFFELKHNELSTHLVDKKKLATPKPVRTVVLIEGLDTSILMNKLEPLMIRPSIEGATVWLTFSAPTYTFEKLYNFNKDAFIIVDFNNSIDASIIQLFSHIKNSPQGFILEKSYTIDTAIEITATQAADVKPEEAIYIGSSLDLSQSNFIMGERVSTGINLAIHAENKKNIIKGNIIKAIILDDGYVPRHARANVERLKKEFNISTLVLPIGTPTVLAIEDLIKEGEVFAAFPVTGSPLLRNPAMKGIINFRPTHTLEATLLTKLLIEKYRIKTFGFFYQDDAYGKESLEAAKEVLKSQGITHWVEIPYIRNTTDFSKEIEILKKEKVEALGCFSTSLPTQDFLRQVGADLLASVKIFCLAFLCDDIFESFVKNDMGLNCLFSRTVPNPTLSKIELAREYRSLMDELGKPYDVFSFEAYICMSLICDLMKNISGPITHKLLLAQCEALKDYNYKGLNFNFNPENRQISNRIWLDSQDGNDWIELTK